MPATPARIGFVLEPWRRAAAEDATALTRHGTLARESDDPVETFFHDVDDAQDAADERLALVSPERRRFMCEANGLEEALALDLESGVIPTAEFTDPRFAASDKPVLLAEIGFDFEKQVAAFMLWG